MEVKKHHNFAVNGGYIVHNCMDCLRYAMVDLPDNPADLIMFVGSYFLNDAKKKKKMNTAEMLFRHALDLDEPEMEIVDWYNN